MGVGGVRTHGGGGIKTDLQGLHRAVEGEVEGQFLRAGRKLHAGLVFAAAFGIKAEVAEVVVPYGKAGGGVAVDVRVQVKARLHQGGGMGHHIGGDPHTDHHKARIGGEAEADTRGVEGKTGYAVIGGLGHVGGDTAEHGRHGVGKTVDGEGWRMGVVKANGIGHNVPPVFSFRSV